MNRQNFSRSSTLLAFGTLTSRVLGLVRQMLLAYAIGSIGFIANAYATAGRVPNLIYTLIISGALSAVLVPQITRAALRRDGGQAYIQKLLTLALVAGGIITVLGLMLTPVMIFSMTPGWNAEQKRLALFFAFWLLPQIFFFVLFTVAGEVLNARSFFGPYAWAPIVNNVIHICGLLVFCYLFGTDPDGANSTTSLTPLGLFLLAGTSTLGIATQALVLLQALQKVGVRFRLDFSWRGYGLAQIGKAASWTLGSVALGQFTGLLNATMMNRSGANNAGFATSEFANLIFVLPHAIIVVSIVMAAFTQLSENVHAGDFRSYRALLRRTVTLTVLTMSLCTCLLTVLAFQISRILQPTAALNTVTNVAIVLLCYVVGLVPFSLTFVLNRGFFALGDTRTPFFITAGYTALAVSAAICTLLLPAKHITWVIVLSCSLLYFLQVGVVIYCLHKRVGTVVNRAICTDTAKVCGASAVTVAAGLGVLNLHWLPVAHSSVGQGVTWRFTSDTHVITTGVPAFDALIVCVAVGFVMLTVFITTLALTKHSAATPFMQKFLRR